MAILSLHQLQCILPLTAAVLIVISAGQKVSVDMDFVRDCCYGRCGTLISPLWLASGLDKTNFSIETLYVATVNETDRHVDISRSNDGLCLITVYSYSSATMNLRFYIRKSKTGRNLAAVTVMDSYPITLNKVEATDSEESISRPQRSELGDENVVQRFNNKVSTERYEQNSDRVSVRVIRKHYSTEWYRIRPKHQIIIAVPVKYIRNGDVHIVFASFVADKATSGWYRRAKKSRPAAFRLPMPQRVHYNAAGKGSRYHSRSFASDNGSETPGNDRGTRSPKASPALHWLRPKGTFQGDVLQLKDKKCRSLSLPAHDLLRKQNARRKLLRPMSVASETSQMEFAFPGIDPNREGEEPPAAIIRPKDQHCRVRVVSHLVLPRSIPSTEDLCSDSVISPYSPG
ncbi:uncharacterized protein LOC111250200 isoform X2 [Varroa destructor]|uniref:Uncharacterized protein n=1 Tax=Varroa destructor TaxID=109461 RepID=A0A7M7K5L7_VARDE|nr:uncharacterized protein LOC111250200 isoform X2 [Varroa destructor]